MAFAERTKDVCFYIIDLANEGRLLWWLVCRLWVDFTTIATIEDYTSSTGFNFDQMATVLSWDICSRRHPRQGRRSLRRFRKACSNWDPVDRAWNQDFAG